MGESFSITGSSRPVRSSRWPFLRIMRIMSVIRAISRDMRPTILPAKATVKDKAYEFRLWKV